MVNRLELPILLLALAVTWLIKRHAPAWFRRSRRAFTRFADRRWASVIATGAIGAGMSLAVSVAGALPEARIHDEFSYLLAADTFTAGRITNPEHPHWVFFETFHVNVRPTYCSIYPPGQGLFLALGQRLTGEAITGVWLSFGLASAAVCVMLQAYLPPRWALWGALLCTLRVGLLGSWAGQQGYWTQSYWGGAVAMLGGALAFGAVPRIVSQPRISSSLLLGIGLSVLAISRPYEGLALSLPIVVVLLAWAIKTGRQLGVAAVVRIAMPLVLTLACTVGAMAYYNFRLTGNPLRLAYQESAATYAVVPTFIWQSPQPAPAYHHAVIEDYQTRWAGDRYLAKRSLEGYARDLGTRLSEFASFFLGISLVVPLVALPWIVQNRWLRFASIGCGCVLLALSATTWFQPHYAAPLTVPLFALVVQGFRYARLWRWDNKPIGRVFVRAVPVVYAALTLIALGEITGASENSWHRQRAGMRRELEADGNRHLVFVRYGTGHDCTEEWVYNRADIEGAKVVWARDMGDDANRILCRHFADRKAWLLSVGENRIELEPYLMEQTIPAAK